MNRKTAIKKTQKLPRDWSRAKIIVVWSFVFLAWLGLWVRAGVLQIVEGPELAKKALRQHVASELDRGSRGQILDRNGMLLAKSIEMTAVYVRPAEVAEPQKAASELSVILNAKKQDLLDKLTSKKSFVYLERRVGDKTAAKIREANLDGVFLGTAYGRSYPNRHLAGQLLGFVNVDDKGVEGLESAMNDLLAGRKAEYVVQRDASGRRFYLDEQGRELNNLNGHDVRLTIDAHIQFFAEEELAKAVKKHQGVRGATVVVHVPTAEILAWANYPFFNPNNMDALKPGSGRNRAAVDVYEPGSTMKPLLVAAALQEGVVRANTKIFCENGRYAFAKRIIRDTHPYKDLTVAEIVRSSSNIGAAKIGEKLGPGKLFAYFNKLGFGKRTGLPLAGESPGIMRPLKRWTPIDTATASFGQGVGVTAIQLVQAFHILANDGLYKPLKLVIEDDPGRLEAAPVRVFDSEVARTVQRMMRDVVHEEGGTGKNAMIEGLDIGGKTGTAQKARPGGGGYGNKYLGSFIAFVPAEGPEYIVLTMIDEPEPSHYGGVVAAPAVREVTLKTLAYLGRMPETVKLAKGGEQIHPIQADREILEIANVAASPTLDARAVPDFAGMPLRRAVEILAGKGIVPKLVGQGLVVSGQSPAPGASWPGENKDAFVLRLARPS